MRTTFDLGDAGRFDAFKPAIAHRFHPSVIGIRAAFPHYFRGSSFDWTITSNAFHNADEYGVDPAEEMSLLLSDRSQLDAILEMRKFIQKSVDPQLSGQIIRGEVKQIRPAEIVLACTLLARLCYDVRELLMVDLKAGTKASGAVVEFAAKTYQPELNMALLFGLKGAGVKPNLSDPRWKNTLNRYEGVIR